MAKTKLDSLLEGIVLTHRSRSDRKPDGVSVREWKRRDNRGRHEIRTLNEQIRAERRRLLREGS